MNFYKFRETNFNKFFIVVLLLVFVLPNFLSFAQMTPEKERAQLERELKELEEKIRQYDVDITKTEAEKQTLRHKINTLRRRIDQLDIEIRKSNLIIRDLGLQIKDTETSIEKTSLKIEDLREKLAGLLRITYEENQKSLIEILFSEATLSGFFDNLMALETLNLKNQELLEDIKNLKSSLESQKQALSEERADLQRVAAIQILQKEEGARAKKEQERLLRLTETEYQKYLRGKAEVERKTAEIRARIFELIGVPEAPTFGQALELAIGVQGQTGIRPAFLLAIITQESALGRNVGQCYLPRDPAENQRRRIMAAPPRSERNDVKHFLAITQELGRDPYKTLISCPMAVGWGGAMGPAQFIPSTWARRRHILEPFVEEIPNPWDIRHAFLASALYLRDLGGQANERRAALQYFAGGNWADPRFAFYGRQVMERTECLQTFIDHGTMTGRCEGLIFIPR